MDQKEAGVTALVVTVTANPALDLATAVDHVEPDRKLRCDEPRRDPGGGGLNVARVITRLGASSLAMWAKGGPTGDLLATLLDSEGIRHHPIAIDGIVRESLAVLDRSSGRQFRFNMPGPTLAPKALVPFLDALRRLDPFPPIVVGSGSLPPGVDAGFYGDLADAVAAAGARFILDTQGPPLRLALDRRCVYLIKPNLRELGTLVGHELADDAGVTEAARALVDTGACQVVFVSLGAGGALIVTGDAAHRIVAPTVPVRSRIGAGDSTLAGTVAALARGESLEQAVRLGVAAGAAAVMTPGTELCRREDVERLVSQMA